MPKLSMIREDTGHFFCFIFNAIRIYNDVLHAIIASIMAFR